MVLARRFVRSIACSTVWAFLWPLNLRTKSSRTSQLAPSTTRFAQMRGLSIRSWENKLLVNVMICKGQMPVRVTGPIRFNCNIYHTDCGESDHHLNKRARHSRIFLRWQILLWTVEYTHKPISPGANQKGKDAASVITGRPITHRLKGHTGILLVVAAYFLTVS